MRDVLQACAIGVRDLDMLGGAGYGPDIGLTASISFKPVPRPAAALPISSRVCLYRGQAILGAGICFSGGLWEVRLLRTAPILSHFG